MEQSGLLGPLETLRAGSGVVSEVTQRVHVLPPRDYSPAGHMVTGDTNIVQNDLRCLILKRPKFRESCSSKSQKNFMTIMNPVEEYARRWKRNLTPCLSR
jgi:hypothetical protein